MKYFIVSIEKMLQQPCCYSYLQQFDESSIFSKFVCAWKKLFDNTYLICSNNNIINQLQKDLVAQLQQNNISFFISECDLIKYQGFLNQPCWDWINEHKPKKDLEQIGGDSCADSSMKGITYL